MIRKALTAGLFLSLLVWGTSAMAQKQKAPKQDNSVATAIINSQPSTRPFRAQTSFSTALQCMDRLLLSYGKKNISIMAEEFSDPTGTIRAGARSMFVDALATMSQTSGAFVFVDLDLSRQNVITMRTLLNGRTAGADYYVVGNFVRSDQGISEWGRRIGAAIQQVSIGTSKDQMVSVVGLDMAIGETRTAILSNDVRTANEIAVVRHGKSTNAELLLPFASLGFDMHADTSEGTHEAVRTLIDLSTIELVGKFTRVPYWKCLQVPETDPAVVRVAQAFFYKMKPNERIAALQAALGRSGEYKGQADGQASPAFGEAVAAYRAKANLAVSTNPDFELYFSLLNGGYIVVEPTPPDGKGRDRDGSAAMSALAKRDDPLEQGLTLDIQPSSPNLVKGDSFRLTVSVSKDSYVYCFVTGPRQGGEGPPNAVRIFPNRFVHDAFVKASDPLILPENEEDMRLRAKDSGVERVMCLARAEPFSNPLPRPVAMEDLTELNRTMSEVEYDLQSYDRKALRSVVKVVELYVGEPGSQ